MNRKKRLYKVEIIVETTAETVADGLKQVKERWKKYSPQVRPLKLRRSERQNNSLHLYLTQWAELLNDNGIGMKMIVGNNMDIPVTMELLKDNVWKKIQKEMFGFKSTTELDNDKEINAIVDSISKFFGELYGLYVPWPSEETRKEVDL